MNKDRITAIVSNHRGLFRVMLAIFNYINPKNRLRKGKNRLSIGLALLSGVKIKIYGRGNEIIINDFARLKDCRIAIRGNNNRILIDEFASLNQAELYFEDNENEILIGKRAALCGKAHLAAIESTKITIGDDCLLSADLHFRTGDSHSIIDKAGKRTNPSEDIAIGSHVWIGTKVTCLKGVTVADNCIVAATSTLCSKYETPGCIIGGVPAKTLKAEMNWVHERIKMN